MALVGTFPFNSFLSGVLSCVGTAVLAGKWWSWFKIFGAASYAIYAHAYTSVHSDTFFFLKQSTLRYMCIDIIQYL